MAEIRVYSTGRVVAAVAFHVLHLWGIARYRTKFVPTIKTTMLLFTTKILAGDDEVHLLYPHVSQNQ